MDAEISIQYSSARFARSVMQSLEPDNKLSSGRTKITARVHGKVLNVAIKNCERIETLQATIQDIFRCIRAAESSLGKIA